MPYRFRRLILALMMLLLPLQGLAAAVVPWCGDGQAQAADQHAGHHGSHHQNADDAPGGSAESSCSHCAWCMGGGASLPPSLQGPDLAPVAALDPPLLRPAPYAAPSDQPYRPPLSTFA